MRILMMMFSLILSCAFCWAAAHPIPEHMASSDTYYICTVVCFSVTMVLLGGVND